MVAAVLKRLVHRNPNVQLYALAVVEALSKNCGIQIHREIASRSFTQGLEKLVLDRVSASAVAETMTRHCLLSALSPQTIVSPTSHPGDISCLARTRRTKESTQQA